MPNHQIWFLCDVLKKVYKMHQNVKSTITICLQYISNMFTIEANTGALLLFICLHVDPSSGIYVNWINFNSDMDK